MGITVGVTGHTRGFGKHIFEALPEPKKGYSRSNGYDICNPYFVEQVGCIINCAENGWGQMHIATRAHELDIYCINIGSLITDAQVTEEYAVAKDAKIALRAYSELAGQAYLTWGFLQDHPIAQMNPELVETITVQDAVKDVINEYKRSLAIIQHNV